MKHALFFILLALSMSCVKTVEKPLYIRSVGMEDTRGKSATLGLSNICTPSQSRSINSGDRILMFSDSVFVNMGDTVFLRGFFMSIHTVVPENVTFQNVALKLNGIIVGANISADNGYISVTLTTPTALVHRMKFSLTGDAFGPSGISYRLYVDQFDITRGKFTQTLLPVENLGSAYCALTDFN